MVLGPSLLCPSKAGSPPYWGTSVPWSQVVWLPKRPGCVRVGGHKWWSFRGCLRSAAAAALHLILVEVDGKCLCVGGRGAGLGADGGGWEPTVVGWEPTVVGREGRGQRGTRKVLPRAPDRGRDENLGYSSRPPSNQSFYLSLGSAGRKFELKTASNVRFHI